MTKETKQRINAYGRALPGMKEKIGAAMVMLLIAVVTAAAATYAWVTLSRSPEVSNITTTLSANGNLEIALSKEDGSMPDEFDIDESAPGSRDVTVTNLQWGNLVNLADDRYGFESLALRPAQLNEASLLTTPLLGAVYGEDGRVTRLDSNYTYVKWNNSANQFEGSRAFGVRAIASYIATVSDSSKLELQEKIQAVRDATTVVNNKYSQVVSSFSGLGRMISRFAQDKVNGSSFAVDPNDVNSDMGQFIPDMLKLYNALNDTMIAQRNAYTALANLQLYQWVKSQQDLQFVPITWEEIEANYTRYNATSSNSQDGRIKLTGLTQFIQDQAKLQADIDKLNVYNEKRQTENAVYRWSEGGDPGFQISDMITRMINYGSMYVILGGTKVPVVNLQSLGADLLQYNNSDQAVYVTAGIMKRFEDNVIDSNYRLNGNAQCTIAIQVKKIITINYTLNGQAYTEATGVSAFQKDYATASTQELSAQDIVAQDTYGVAVDLWLRTNAEQTCLTLEGATTTDQEGNILSYDGINRVWGSTGEAVLTTDSTTQGGGSCYVYYADTPEDMMRSLDLLDSMKVAFVDQYGNLLAKAGMDTVNYYALNGRITVPLVLDSDTKTTYTYTNELNQEMTGRAITTMHTDTPILVTAIIYLDGTRLTNDDVLAASEIQGQLNIQFGSSANLKTIGSNELIDDTRSVTATVSKNSMDYDTAVVDADLTTDVTLSVQGTDPRDVTAFFVRAINSTQGSREQPMTFTKQADGTWTSSYKFTAPGTYYLRHVRLDGVDYALAEPQIVEVAGFTLESVTWSEPGTSAVVRTSATSYPVSVSAKFASSDRSKLPSSVQARFVRADGNTVNIPLTYKASSGMWEGTGTFSTSGVYTLEYLVFDNKYKDLASQNMTKTLDLSLGIYAVVNNASGSLTDVYEPNTSYPKDVTVRLLDNAGNMLTALEGVRLEYSNGGSVTNTITIDLTWNHITQDYSGTLPFTKPGRYVFMCVLMDGSNAITRATESPVYTIISPEPPVFDTTSECTYNGDNIQFVPLTNDAKIDNIKIRNAESASVAAVVYNDKTGEYYQLDGSSVAFTGNAWSIKLPTYWTAYDAEGNPAEGAVETQEGTWSLVCLYLTDCYDASSNYRDNTNPIIWAGNDGISDTYLSRNNLTASERIDFSKLSTKVSCSLKVQMVPGTTTLGSSTADFMSRYPVSGLGMYALLTDDAGNVIPSGKVGDVTLNVYYTPDSVNGTYGYKVQSGAARSYAIELNAQDPEDGRRTVSAVSGAADFDWQYVGVYSVQNLQVTLGGTTKTYTVSDNIGLASAYTLTTAGPDSDNIKLLDENITQRYTTLGKTGNNITGTFLQGGDLGVTAKISLTTDDPRDNTQYVLLDDVSVQLVLTHQGGSQANGGYTFTYSDYETVTLVLNPNGETYVAPSASNLLAGTYKAQLKATVGSVNTTKDLNNVSVFSKQPTLKVTGVSPNVSTSFKMNTYFGDGKQSYNNARLVDVQNYYTDTLANVYIKAEETIGKDVDGDTFNGYPLVDYTLPQVTVTLSDIGTNFGSASASVTNSTQGFSFTPSALSSTAEIGTIGTGTFSYEKLVLVVYIATNVNYETQTAIGEQTLRTITITDKNGAEYAMTVAGSGVTIREKAEAPASISYAPVSGYTTPTGQTSTDGGSLTVTLPTSIGTTTGDYDKTDESVNWTTDSTASKTLTYYTVDHVSNSESGTCTKTYSSTVYFNYYPYTRTTVVEKKTSTTQTWRATYGLVGWIINGQEYAPGETITVSSVVTATPKIGIISEVQLGEDQVKTIRRTTITDTAGTVAQYSVTKENNSSASAAETAARNAYADKKPSTWEWFDASDATKDGHYSTPQVETVTES